jgi:hypothetical protein
MWELNFVEGKGKFEVVHGGQVVARGEVRELRGEAGMVNFLLPSGPAKEGRVEVRVVEGKLKAELRKE